MKQTFNKSLLALVCAVGIASTPQAFAAGGAAAPTTPSVMAGNVATGLIVWEILSLLHMAKKGSKADFEQRAFLDMSASLLKSNPKQWAKNAARNIEIAQSDYFEGQAYKGASLKLNHEGKLEQGKKCLPCGFNGKLLEWIAAINKNTKNVKEVALLVFTLKGVRDSEAFMKWLGWSDTTGKKEDHAKRAADAAVRAANAAEKQAAAAERAAAAAEEYNRESAAWYQSNAGADTGEGATT